MNETNSTQFSQDSHLPPGSLPQASETRAPTPPPAARAAYDNQPRWSPGKAAFLSSLPGLGQAYAGYYLQGFINILIVGSTVTLLNSTSSSLEPLLGFFLAFFWIFNMIDASRRAAFRNQALTQYGNHSWPESYTLPGNGGSLAGGIGMVIFGVIALLYTKFEISLAWLADWWPILLVLAGAYLIVQSIRQKQNSRSRPAK